MATVFPTKPSLLLSSDAAAIALDTLDTGQLDEATLDTGQLDEAKLDTSQLDEIDSADLLACVCDESLAVTFHEIHRIDKGEGGQRDLITSTLKYFSLEVAVQDPHTKELLYHLDGTSLVASLVYEGGAPVEALSATLEPPLLATQGECSPKAVIEGGCATFKLRITVLSSLCQKQLFCVKVVSAARPALTCLSAPTKTITKLRRGVREAADKASPAKTIGTKRAPVGDENLGTYGAKRALSLAVGDEFGCLQELVPCDLDEAALCDSLSGSTLAELWDEVSKNGARLLELQGLQRKLFSELRALKADDATAAVDVVLA